jgi:hypothetical protein
VGERQRGFADHCLEVANEVGLIEVAKFVRELRWSASSEHQASWVAR